jgi:hypothetical protein
LKIQIKNGLILKLFYLRFLDFNYKQLNY